MRVKQNQSSFHYSTRTQEAFDAEEAVQEEKEQQEAERQVQCEAEKLAEEAHIAHESLTRVFTGALSSYSKQDLLG